MKKGFVQYFLWAVIALTIMFMAFAFLPLFNAVANISTDATSQLVPIVFIGLVAFGVFILGFPRGS